MVKLFTRKRENWYKYLFHKLDTRFEEFDKNSLSVLTFNYDRSLEHFLYTALLNTYGKTERECVEKLRALPIIHLYGQLGELPYINTDGIRFDGTVNADKLRKCVEGIKIIHEDVSGNPRFQQAQELLAKAERICFLGFGYDQTNLERLMVRVTNRDQHICGSAVGFRSRECQFIENRIKKMGFKNLTSIASYHDCGDTIDFLREMCPLDWD